jgi:hypothetical protein
MINHTTKQILNYKANALKTSPEYLAYVEKVLEEWGIKDTKEAFILGAIDAMINSAASVMNNKGIAKKSLLKEIMEK